MIFRRFNQGTPGRLGGGLPIYPEQASVAHNRRDMRSLAYYPWVCPENMGIPFQFSCVSGGVSAWRAVSVLGTSSNITLSLGALSSECYDGNKTLVTYNGGAIALSAGVWQFQLDMAGLGTVYSDIFHACDSRAESAILVKWKDSKDWLGGIYYGAGYENKMWVDSEFARSRGEFYEETVDDGFGRKIPVYQRMEEVYGFDVICTDSMVNVFYSMQMHDTVTINPEGLGATTVMPGTLRVSDTGERSNALAIMEVSFKVDAAEATTIDEELFELGTC